ncbi:hypothetical protein GMSM_43010 [Geomonas sp. Red276]
MAFPAGSDVTQGDVNSVNAGTTAPTVEVKTLEGKSVASVHATVPTSGSGAVTYEVGGLTKGDYVIKVTNGNKVIKGVVDQGSMTSTTVTKNIDKISTAAVHLTERKIGVVAGTIGEAANASVSSSSVAGVQPAVLEKTIKSAVDTVLYAPASATQSQVDLANVVNVVAATVTNGVDTGSFLAGTSTTTQVNTVQYTIQGGSAVAGGPAPVSAGTAQSTVAAATTGYNPPPDAVSFTSKVAVFTSLTAYNPLQGVTVTTVGLSPEITTTSDANGSFTLAGIPQGTPFYIKMSLSGYAGACSNTFSLAADLDVSDRPYALPTMANLTNLGNQAGNGLIRTRVVSSTNQVSGFLAGAVVSAVDQADQTVYPVIYTNSSGQLDASLTATDGTYGQYTVLNIPAGHTVVVSVSKSGYTFPNKTFVINADSMSQGRSVGTATTGGGSTTGAAFTQADLTGTWNLIHFYTGADVVNSLAPGWVIVKATVASNGAVTINSYLDSVGNTDVNIVGGTINWTIDGTGSITESGTAAFTQAPKLQMSSNKAVAVGVATDGNAKLMRVAVKQTGSFSNADLTGPLSYTSCELGSGTDNYYAFVTGSLDSTRQLLVANKIETVPNYGPPSSGVYLDVASNGAVSVPGSPNFHGFLTPDKSMMFFVGTSGNTNGYMFGVASIGSQSFSSADLVGNYVGYGLANEPTPVWERDVAYLDASGNFTPSAVLDSTGNTSLSGSSATGMTIGSTGLISQTSDASTHGFLSRDKKVVILNSTWDPGAYAIAIFLK